MALPPIVSSGRSLQFPWGSPAVISRCPRLGSRPDRPAGPGEELDHRGDLVRSAEAPGGNLLARLLVVLDGVLDQHTGLDLARGDGVSPPAATILDRRTRRRTQSRRARAGAPRWRTGDSILKPVAGTHAGLRQPGNRCSAVESSPRPCGPRVPGDRRCVILFRVTCPNGRRIEQQNKMRGRSRSAPTLLELFSRSARFNSPDTLGV